MAEREFPTPTEEVEEQVEALRERGYVILENVLDRTEVAVLKEALAPYLQGKRHGRNDFEGFHTERTYALLAKSAEFVRIVDHPRISPIVDQLLEPTYLLWAALAINLHPGETRQRLHRDNLGGPGAIERCCWSLCQDFLCTLAYRSMYFAAKSPKVSAARCCCRSPAGSRPNATRRKSAVANSRASARLRIG